MSELERLQRRANRERVARKHAEAVIEEKSRELYQANLRLGVFNEELEERVAEATSDLLQSNQLLKRRIGELAALNSVARALCSVTDVKILLERIIELSKEVMQAEAASLLLKDEHGQLRFHVATGRGAAAITDLTVELGQGIAGYVAQSGTSQFVPDAYADPRFDPSYDAQTDVRTTSLMAAPIKVKDETIGVVEVVNRIGDAPFDENDLDLFESFAASAGVAIENARLFDETRRMAEELRQALEKERWLAIEKDKMGAFVPKYVRDEIARNREEKLALGGKTVVVSVMFSDIIGFTRISETMKPERLVSFLNQYMTHMVEAIESAGGILNQFLGDGLMAIFPQVDAQGEHARSAVRAGIDMQRQLDQLREQWKTSCPELAGLRMRVGINTGEAVAGNVGSQTRMDFTVVGDTVNTASRIESNCLPDAVLISASTFEELKNEITAERMVPIQVKNRVQPVQTYSVFVERKVAKDVDASGTHRENDRESLPNS